jgi:hypothetical protein
MQKAFQTLKLGKLWGRASHFDAKFTAMHGFSMPPAYGTAGFDLSPMIA